MSTVAYDNAAASAAEFQRGVLDTQRRGFTRAVEQLEAAEPSHTVLVKASSIKNALDAVQSWSDTSPSTLFTRSDGRPALGSALLIRLAGGYDSKAGLYARLAALRNRAMTGERPTFSQAVSNPTVVGPQYIAPVAPTRTAASGRPVSTQADHERRNGTELGAAASGFLEGAREGAAELGAGFDRFARFVPWLVAGLGLVVALQIVRALRV